MTTSICFWNARGGHGCTTTALLTALAVHNNKGVAVTVTDLVDNGGFKPYTEMDGFVTIGDMHPYDISIYDCGVPTFGSRFDALPDQINVVVLRGPDYVGLSSVRKYQDDGMPIDHVVVIQEPARALTASDVKAVLNIDNVLSIDHSAAVARATDAGLLLSRYKTSHAPGVHGLASLTTKRKGVSHV